MILKHNYISTALNYFQLSLTAKIVALIIVFFSSVQFGYSQSGRFEETCLSIIRAFNNQDSALVNSFIHPNQKITVLFRRGVYDQFDSFEHLSFTTPSPEYFPYPKFETELPLQYGELPKFDCNSGNWTKLGLYCDTLNCDHLLSKTAINYNRYELRVISQSQIDAFVKLEEISRRIVLTDQHGESLVFYVSLIEGKWYLTILDRVTGDCSA